MGGAGHSGAGEVGRDHWRKCHPELMRLKKEFEGEYGMAAIRKRDGYDWKFEAEERSREVAKLKAVIRKAAEIIDTNLHHQREKVSDASAMLKAALKE